MGRVGRPSGSVIRSRVQQIIDALGVTYGYEIFKIYNDAFEPIDIRAIYYHLNKGVENGEFVETEQKASSGAFTWGEMSMRKYYTLGLNATEHAHDDLHIIIKTLGFEYKDPDTLLNWNKISKNKLDKYTKDLEMLIKRRGFKRMENQKKLEKLLTKIDAVIGILSNKADLSPWFDFKNNVQRFIE